MEDKEYLKKFLTTPPVKKIDLHFPLGLEVTARNLKGVTIKDALDAIYKQFRKKVCACRSSGYPESPSIHPPTPVIISNKRKQTDIPPPQADDELEAPVLAGFEWDKEESWTRLIVHCKKEGAAPVTKKSKKKTKEEGEE